MSTTTAGVLFTGSLVLALALAYRPLGDYMYRVFTRTRHARAEKVIYRLIGVQPDAEQTWAVYARSVLAFSVVSVKLLYGLQRLQSRLLLSLGFRPVMTHRAWNTAISFTTNTNWQSYSGESTMGHLVQMAGLAVQNFVSAAVGIAVAIALVRGFARTRNQNLGNFLTNHKQKKQQNQHHNTNHNTNTQNNGRTVQNFHDPHTIQTLAG